MRQRLAASAAALLLTACSGQEPPERRTAPAPPAPAPPAPVSSAAPTPAASASAARPSASPTGRAPRTPSPPPPPAQRGAPFPADRSRDTATHDGARLSVVDLRFGRHDGYDRVVVDLAGDGRPGWFATYRDVARHQGSGHRVDVDGRTVLEVSVTGVRYPNERGAQPYGGPEVLRPGSAGVVAQVLRGSVYEGRQQVFIGLDAREQPFRVFRLTHPPRVVVDVQHPR